MISSAILEQPGKWRILGISAGLLLALAPSLALLTALDGTTGTGPVGGNTDVFAAALMRSLAVGLAVSVLAVVIGLPTGVLAGLYDFRLRRVFLALLALPLLIPSFLSAIGISMLRIALGLPADGYLSGLSGTTLAFATFGVPLVAFITLASVRGISRNQVDAARLGGGELHLAACVARAVFPAAAMTGVLAGVLTLSRSRSWTNSRPYRRSLRNPHQLCLAIRLRLGRPAMLPFDWHSFPPGLAHGAHARATISNRSVGP